MEGFEVVLGMEAGFVEFLDIASLDCVVVEIEVKEEFSVVGGV